MKNIAEIQDSIIIDSDIDRTKLEHEILKTPKLMSKYLKWHYEYKVAMGLCESKLNTMIRDKMKFYQGKGTDDEYKRIRFNDVCTNQKDLERYIMADPDMCSVKERIAEVESGRDLLYDMIQSLRYRNNSIASIIELRKFEAGA